MRVLAERRTDLETPGPFGQRGDELVVDRVLDDHPARGGAALAGLEEAAVGGDRHRLVEIGVGEDHQRVLAAHLHLHPRLARDRVLRDARTDALGAGKADRGDVLVIDDRLADPAATEHEVEDPWRDSCVMQDLRQRRRHGRGDVGRLEHHGVAERQRRGGLPCGNRDGEVPRGDEPDDAERLAVGCDIEAGAGGFERLPVAPQRFAREVQQDARRAQGLADALGAGLAFLAGEQLADLARAGEQRLTGLAQHVGAHLGRGVRPARLRVLRRGDRLGYFGLAAIREAGDDLVGVRRRFHHRRRAPFERAVRAGPFAADVMAEDLRLHRIS